MRDVDDLLEFPSYLGEIIVDVLEGDDILPGLAEKRSADELRVSLAFTPDKVDSATDNIDDKSA